MHLYWAFPELTQYEDDIYMIDATINAREVFIVRDTIELVEDILQAHKQGKTKFLFYMFTEAVMPYILLKVQRIANLLQDVIPSHSFVYLSGAVNGEESYDNLVKKYSITNKITVLSTSMFHNYLKNSIINYQINAEYDVVIKAKKFLCFNKLEREQRLLLMDRMLQYNYVDLGHYSFESSDVDTIQEMIEKLPTEFVHIKKHKDRFPLKLNINPNRTNPVNVIPDDLHYFNSSYFSIVNETLFFASAPALYHQPLVEDSSIFISEKTYKCLAVQHPFIIFGRPGIIKALRELGFKTFHPYFDESYDDIIDDRERFDAIFNEITRLIHLSDEEWINLQQSFVEILAYNKELFYNKTTFGVSKDVVGKITNNGLNH